MKIAPLQAALRAHGASVFLVHTGQHYDAKMSDVFFDELGIPAPDLHLGIGSGDRVAQTQKIIEALVPVLKERKPDCVIVVGDVTSTVGGTLAAVIAGVKVAHVEAGLRSFHLGMPEEVNRIITDHYVDYLFVTEPIAGQHLQQEGIDPKRVFHVGNVMIDTLRKSEARADEREILKTLGVEGDYGILTLHRPDNVDHKAIFRDLWETVTLASTMVPLFMPIHHRTKAKIEAFGLEIPSTIKMIEPVGYLDMLHLMKHAKVVLTDSGGVQEETTALGVPCLTLRLETERPITIDMGTNELLGRDRVKILEAMKKIMNGKWKKGRVPELWDGKAAERIADILLGL